MLTLISHITGQFELKFYYSNKMTERPGDYTLHNIWSTLCAVEVIEAWNLASYKKVQVGKDQEKAQSEKDSHSKNRGGKNQTNNQVYIP